MTVFRWIIGIVAALFGTAAIAAFLGYMATGMSEWLHRTRRMRRLAWATALLWFNVEIWRRVVLVLVNWVH